MSVFVIRLDDVCPTMDWAKFGALHDLFRKHRVKPLLGVVPRNEDPGLRVSRARGNFWAAMRRLAGDGWTIAQHGYKHTYATRDAGLLKVNTRSEFAGLAYETQRAMLEKGRTILRKHGLFTDVFMAPAHSFDMNTVCALADLGFKHITDGYGLFPYRLGGLICVPQLISKPLHIGFGVYTICLHPNHMSAADIARIERFVERKHDRIVSFTEAASAVAGNALASLHYHATQYLLVGARRIRELVG